MAKNPTSESIDPICPDSEALEGEEEGRLGRGWGARWPQVHIVTWTESLDPLFAFVGTSCSDTPFRHHSNCTQNLIGCS